MRSVCSVVRLWLLLGFAAGAATAQAKGRAAPRDQDYPVDHVVCYPQCCPCTYGQIRKWGPLAYKQGEHRAQGTTRPTEENSGSAHAVKESSDRIFGVLLGLAPLLFLLFLLRPLLRFLFWPLLRSVAVALLPSHVLELLAWGPRALWRLLASAVLALGRLVIRARASVRSDAPTLGDSVTRARKRLAEEAGPNPKLFTSDLAVNEYLLAHKTGAEPIAQVMGSSIFQLGRIAEYKATGEISTIVEGKRCARSLARGRLFEEAKAVDADAVIAVQVSERILTRGDHGKGGDNGNELVEVTMVGTAVRAPWIEHPPGVPIITDLSGQDLWALYGDGYQPTGLVYDFCRYHVRHVLGDRDSGEVRQASNGLDDARSAVQSRVLAQASAAGGEFVVGSEVSLQIREVPCGDTGCEFNDLDIDISWRGTGIRRMSAAPIRTDVPPLILSMMPLGRSRKELLDAPSEAEELQRQAEELEPDAAERAEALEG